MVIGIVAAIGSCGSNGVSETPTETEPSTPDAVTEAPHAEDHDHGTESSGDADVDYATTLALMKGHLIVAEELLNQAEYDQAEPHFSHPVEELYGDIEPQLAERGVTEFRTTLNQLSDLAQSAPDSAEMTQQLDAAMTTVNMAMAAIPEEQRQSPEFVMAVIGSTLAVAAEEYDAAIVDDQITDAEEYQDSRGFVLYAEQLYQSIAETMAQTSPEDHQVITESLAELKTIWPSVIPSEKPIQPPKAVFELVATIQSKQP